MDEPLAPDAAKKLIRVDTSRITVVVALRSEHELVVVTAWRIGR